MSKWNGVPLEMFDIYIEVGEIRLAEAKDDDCVNVEVWIGSCFTREYLREECKTIDRRSVYGLMKQILKMAGDKQVCITFMCDDIDSFGNDTSDWSSSIYLLVNELRNRGKVNNSTLYTRKSYEEVMERANREFLRQSAKEQYLKLYEILDVLITECANPYHSGE